MKNKKAILFIHGFAGGSYDFGDITNDLQLYDDLDVFLFTLPGHDKLIISDIERNDWLIESERQLKKIINNNYKEIYLIGHSMGGVIAVYLASKYKEISKLILGAPAFMFFHFRNSSFKITDGIKMLPKLFKRGKSRETFSRIFKVPFKTVKEFSFLVQEHSDDVKGVTCPTLILWGNEDDIVPREGIDFVFDNLKSNSVTLAEIDKTNHNLFKNDNSSNVKNLIIDFIRNNNKNSKKKFKI